MGSISNFNLYSNEGGGGYDSFSFNELNGLDDFRGPVSRFTNYNQNHIFQTLKFEYEAEKGIIPDFSLKNVSGIFVDKVTDYSKEVTSLLEKGVQKGLEEIVPSPIQSAITAVNIIDNVPATINALTELNKARSSGIVEDLSIKDTVQIGSNVVQSLLPFTPAAAVAGAIQTGFKLGESMGITTTVINVLKLSDKIFGNPNADNPAPIDNIQLQNNSQQGIQEDPYAYFWRSGGISYKPPSSFIKSMEGGDTLGDFVDTINNFDSGGGG